MCLIITWKCPSCGLTKIDPPNLEELRKRCPHCGASMEPPVGKPEFRPGEPAYPGEECILPPVEAVVDENDRRATQVFAIFNVLTGHCDKDFSADKIEAAMVDIEREMSEGGCAWAFEGPAKDGTPSWYHDGKCICQSSPPGFVAKDGVHCGMCGGTLRPREPPEEPGRCHEVDPTTGERCFCDTGHEGFHQYDSNITIECPKCGGAMRDSEGSLKMMICPKCNKPPTEEPKTIPKAVIDAFRDDEAALLKEYQERKAEHSIRCRCCRECVSFHQSRAKQLVSLADPGASNDGCTCRCHDPSTPEGAGLIKHFDSLDLQDEVDKMETPTNHPLNCPAVYSLGDDEACSTCLVDPRPFDKCPPLTEEPPACFGELSLCVISKGLQEEEAAKEPEWKCIACGQVQPATNEVCPHCGQLQGLVREPDDMIGRGGTDPNEREKE